MRATQQLSNLGQSLWLDNITRAMLDDGTIRSYVDEYSVTGLTSNPSIFDSAIGTGAYDEAIAASIARGQSNEEIFFEIAVADLRRAADLFAASHERTAGVDGWVSLEVSPLLAYDADATVSAARSIHRRVDRPNLLVKIPGTTEGLGAIEECIASGIPVNVTLLFDAEQYLAAADAYLRGIERRVAAGEDPVVGSVASLFVSRWDVAIAERVPAELKNELGIAVGHDVYRAYRELLASERFQRLENAGARAQRLLWASTKTKDPAASDTLYVERLASPHTVNTMPDSTLHAVFDHGTIGTTLPVDGGRAHDVLTAFAAANVDVKELGERLQVEGAEAFVSSWNALLAKIEAQRSAARGA